MRPGNFYRRALFVKVMLPLAALGTGIALALVHRFFFYSPPRFTERSIGEILVMAVIGFLIGAGLSVMYLHFLPPRQLRRQGLGCLRCGYPLRTLPGAGHCPECGRRYVRADVAQTWRQLIIGRSRLKPDPPEPQLKKT